MLIFPEDKGLWMYSDSSQNHYEIPLNLNFWKTACLACLYMHEKKLILNITVIFSILFIHFLHYFAPAKCQDTSVS